MKRAMFEEMQVEQSNIIEDLDELEAREPELVEELFSDEALAEYYASECNGLDDLLVCMLEDAEEDEGMRDLTKKLARAMGVDISSAIAEWEE